MGGMEAVSLLIGDWVFKGLKSKRKKKKKKADPLMLPSEDPQLRLVDGINQNFSSGFVRLFSSLLSLLLFVFPYLLPLPSFHLSSSSFILVLSLDFRPSCLSNLSPFMLLRCLLEVPLFPQCQMLRPW